MLYGLVYEFPLLCCSTQKAVCWMACTGRSIITMKKFQLIAKDTSILKTSCWEYPDFGRSECAMILVRKYLSITLIDPY